LITTPEWIVLTLELTAFGVCVVGVWTDGVGAAAWNAPDVGVARSFAAGVEVRSAGFAAFAVTDAADVATRAAGFAVCTAPEPTGVVAVTEDAGAAGTDTGAAGTAGVVKGTAGVVEGTAGVEGIAVVEGTAVLPRTSAPATAGTAAQRQMSEHTSMTARVPQCVPFIAFLPVHCSSRISGRPRGPPDPSPKKRDCTMQRATWHFGYGRTRTMCKEERRPIAGGPDGRYKTPLQT
jgi:hypothetical protein